MIPSGAAWMKVRGLEHRPDSPSGPRKVRIWLTEDKRAAARRCGESEQHPQGRCLAGAVGPEEAGDRPRLERKREIVDRDERPEPLRQRLGYDRRLHLHVLPARGSSPLDVARQP